MIEHRWLADKGKEISIFNNNFHKRIKILFMKKIPSDFVT